MPRASDAITVLKGRILNDPGLILEDREMMRALLAADQSSGDRNVIDLRGRLVERLENRLDALQDTHQDVIAAAYENLAGTNQIHRAVLALLAADDFLGFLEALHHHVTDILAVDVIRLGLETTQFEAGRPMGPDGALADLIVAVPRGGAEAYLTRGGRLTPRKVALRACGPEFTASFGPTPVTIGAEAVLMLDLGAGKLPGILIFGTHERGRFNADQGTDLLGFFGAVFQRALRRWLA